MSDELVDEDELADSRSYLTGALPLHMETNDGMADVLLTIEEHGLGLDHLSRYPSMIGAVTREQIRDVVRRYLTLDRNVLAIAGTF